MRGTKISVLALALFLLTSVGCSVEDDRDMCCDKVEINLRYSKGAGDLLDEHIKDATHYLFDEEDRLIDVIKGTEQNKKRLRFYKLKKGRYRLVTVANMTDKTEVAPTELGITKIDEFLLKLKGIQSNGMYGNSDPLYWGVKEFVAEPKKSHKYVLDMSNIHCRLTVTIRWENVIPPGSGDFELQLINVPGKYSLNAHNVDYVYINGSDNGDQTSPRRIIHRFPFVHEEPETLVNHYIKAEYIAGRIKEQFLTLRYTDNRIPTLRLFRGGVQIMKDIDLARAFRSWGWEVSKAIEQDYHIELLIRGDGSVIVSPSAEAIVLDWQDGGVI